MTPAPQPQQEKYNCYAAISNEWKTLEEIIGTHTGSGLPKNSDIVRYRNALNGYVDARLVEKEKEICGRGHNQRYRIRSRPAPQPPQHEFGYFPRSKYEDLVFYIKTGEYSNMGLFEMPDTPENRAIMEALCSRPIPSPNEELIEKLDTIRKHAQEQYREADLSDDLDLMALHLDYENRIWDIMRSLRTPKEQP